MKLHTKTFGCQMNFADSDEMSQSFRERGFDFSDDLEASDAVLVNTCTVRDLAEHKASSYIGRLKDWKKDNPSRMIVVTGCAAERAKAEFKHRFPYVDLIVGAKDIEKFPQELDAALNEKFGQFDELVPNQVQLPSSSDVSQFVTIMRGCNYSCTYCIVPSVRGREVYLPAQKILDDVRARIEGGAKEIWLLGQTVNSYRPTQAPTPGYDFADLLRDVNKVDGLERLRFISPHPYYLTPKLMDAIAECDKVCEHMHLPVQSGSTKMLKAMKRNYTRESFLDAVAQFREKVPNISITTDIIVGFPGETDEDYQQTLSLVDEAGFDSAYCFKYSPRPGTHAADELEDDVEKHVKEERVNHLLEKIDQIGADDAQKQVGQTQEILIEDHKGDGVFRGKNRQCWRVRIKDSNLKPGQLINAQITSHHSRELHAEWARNQK